MVWESVVGVAAGRGDAEAQIGRHAQRKLLGLGCGDLQLVDARLQGDPVGVDGILRRVLHPWRQQSEPGDRADQQGSGSAGRGGTEPPRHAWPLLEDAGEFVLAAVGRRRAHHERVFSRRPVPVGGDRHDTQRHLRRCSGGHHERRLDVERDLAVEWIRIQLERHRHVAGVHDADGVAPRRRST